MVKVLTTSQIIGTNNFCCNFLLDVTTRAASLQVEPLHYIHCYVDTQRWAY